MRFNLTALALTVGLFWGGAILLVASANAIWPNYGQAFLQLAASIYPGYHPVASVREIIVGTVYGFLDGAIGGWLFGWVYNLVSR
ncbi:MAG: hypothetical protein A3G24_06815 [Betaproteobacteria bacterium RIFCSPLOWO2_12_FULL_62_13]|nr:MAG: hypothetical protein A3G24_06815 [Betaproteobacteria bacterium RIFCSPLOWO2_12_FULL_62_13]